MIKVQDLHVRAGSFELREVNFTIPAGSYAVLMGRTGCGKTTLLECLCGLKSVVSGRVLLAEQDVTFLKPGERSVGFVPQDVALFQHMTVREHLEFGPCIQGWSKEAMTETSDQLAEELQITDLLGRRPRHLSGGEKQRVAIGRALSVKPQILCLDEPLSALDEATHESICSLLKALQREHQLTALHITHSQREAEALGDVILTMEKGKVTPRDMA